MKAPKFVRKPILAKGEKALKIASKFRGFISANLQRYASRLAKELTIVLPIIFMGLLILNFLWPQTSWEEIKINILKDFDNPVSHQEAGKIFLQNNLYTQANQELNLARQLSLQPNQEINNLLAQVNQKINEPSQLQTEIVFWEKISDEFPNYRDANLKLAYLNWRIYHLFDAKKFLDQALTLDPNNQEAKQLQSLIER
jgi:hypothetical protein